MEDMYTTYKCICIPVHTQVTLYVLHVFVILIHVSYR